MATREKTVRAALPDSASRQHPSTKTALADLAKATKKAVVAAKAVAADVDAAVRKGRADPKPDPEAKASARVRKGSELKFALPKTVGLCADRYYELRQKRLGINHEADAVKAEETFVKEHLIAVLPKSDTSGVAGKLCRVTVVKKVVPVADDWDKVYAGIVAEYARLKKAGKAPEAAFAILNKAINSAAVGEMWEAGAQVPGVGRFNDVTLSVNKL